MPSVRFNYADVPSISIRNKRAIGAFIKELFILEAERLDHIDFIFCSDEFLLNINKTFLQHDYYTDVITFDLTESELIVGEIYISIETVKSNAVIHNSTFKDELLRVMFHGCLHLCGYNDKRKVK